MSSTEGTVKKLLQGKECLVTHIPPKQTHPEKEKARSDSVHRLYTILTEELGRKAQG